MARGTNCLKKYNAESKETVYIISGLMRPQNKFFHICLREDVTGFINKRVKKSVETKY